MLINTDESDLSRFKHETVTNNCNKKLLGILFNNEFHFDELFTSLCSKVSQKLNALPRNEYMNLAYKLQCSLIMSPFIFS